MGDKTNRNTVLSIILSVFLGISFGLIYTTTITSGIFSSHYTNETFEILAYQSIFAVIIIMITPRRVPAAINSAVFFFISSAFYPFYCLFKSRNIKIEDIIFDALFALITFVISLAIWQYKKGGWLSGLCAAIPLSLFTCICVYLILCLFAKFSLLTFFNILIIIGFCVFFYTKITNDNATKIKTIVFHIVIAGILLLINFWKANLISFNF